jgi:hypothetical protein
MTSGSSAPGDQLAATNGHIHLFGESVKHFFRDQQRSSMTSPMFNLPGRLLLGSYCYYENLPGLLNIIREYASPESIGKGMKQLCSRPNYVHLNSLVLGYLVGREQARLLGQKAADDREDIVNVMDFWAGVARNYRNDGLLLPDESGFTIPILDPPQVTDLENRLRSDFPVSHKQRIRRMLATLELYTFILHGEARVGVFHHGPYPLDNGDCIVVRELIGLREDFYPWTQSLEQPKYDQLAWVTRLRDVQSKIVLFGSLMTQPTDFSSQIVAEEVFVVENGEYRPLPAADVDLMTGTGGDTQLQLYRMMIDWDDRYRIAYGAHLYAGLLRNFAHPLGFGANFGVQILERFNQTVEKHLDNLHSGLEQPVVLQHIAATDGWIFSALDQPGGAAA